MSSLHVSLVKEIDWTLWRGLGVGDDLIGGAVFWAGLGFGGGGRLRRPVGVHAELLGQMHVARFGRHLARAAETGQTFPRPEVNAPLEIPHPPKNKQ